MLVFLRVKMGLMGESSFASHPRSGWSFVAIIKRHCGSRFSFSSGTKPVQVKALYLGCEGSVWLDYKQTVQENAKDMSSCMTYAKNKIP